MNNDEYFPVVLGIIPCTYSDIGIEQDYKQAARYFDKAASQGNAEGIYNFARLTDHGLGVKQDHIAATKLFELAAEKPLPNVGVAEAQHALGLRYAEGVGAEKNLPFAAYWYQRAVDNDCAESANNLATMYLEGNGVEKNLEKAEQLFHLSAKMGDPNAMLTLAQLFVRKNDSKMAKSWHEQACESGNRFARMCRDEFEKFSKFRQDFVNNVPPVLLQMLNQQIDILNSLDAAKTIYRAVDQPSIISYYNELAELANDGSITAKNMCDALDHWSTAFKLLIKTESLTEIEENTFVHELSQCYRIEHIVSQYFDFKIREKINEIIDKVFERITKQLRDGTSQLDEDVRICYVIAHMDSKESTLLFLKQCKEKYPKCIYFFEHAAAINGFLEKYEDLLYEANCGLELDPNYTELLYFRAVALRLIHRDMNQAIEAYQNFLSSAPKDHRKVPESYYSMANCYFMCSTQTDRSDIIKQKYQQGLEAEKLQMPCFLPYQSNSKTVLELNLNINLELRRLKTEPDPYRVRLITKHRESENNRSRMSEFSKDIIVSKTHAPLLKQSIAKSLVGLKPISLKEMVSQKDHVYSDYVITLTIIEETRFWTPSIRLIVEDENHDCERMFIYAFPPNEGQYLVTKVFRSGNRMQVINPYLRFGAYDLERMIRVDDFSSILMLDEKEKTN